MHLNQLNAELASDQAARRDFGTQWVDIIASIKSPLYVRANFPVKELAVEIEVWDIRSPDDVTRRARKQPHSSRASRFVRRLNETLVQIGYDPGKELALAMAVLSALLHFWLWRTCS